MARVGELWVALGADNKPLKKGMQESQDIVKSTMDAISNMKAELASIAAVSLPVMEAKSWAAAVNDLTDKTNMAGEAASRLLAIGEFVGLSSTDMSDALMKMSKSAFEATIAIDEAALAGKRSDDVYTQFGIAIRDSNGQLLSAEQIYQNVVEVHRNMANGLEKTAMEMKIFGRSGAKLNDLLNLTDAEMKRVTDAAEKSGLIISTETSQAWEEFQKSLNLSKMQMKGIAVTIGNEMMPEVNKLVSAVGEAVDWFSELDKETKKNIVSGLELAASISAITVAGRGLMAVLAPMAKFVAGAITGAGAIATAAAATVYKGYADYQHAQGGGDFTYDDTGNVRRVDGSTATEEDQARTDTMALTKGWQYDSSKGQPNKDYRAPTTGGKKDNSEKLAEQAAKITREVSKAQEKMLELGITYQKMQQEIAYAGLDGGARVYAGIAKERDARIQALDDHLKRVKQSVDDAERIREQAQKTGDAAAIRRAQELLDQEKSMQKAAIDQIAQDKLTIDRQTKDELLKNSTAKNAMEQQLQAAMREADYQEYLKYLELYKSADMQAFLEKQAAMEYQHKWQMESMESQATKMLEMADMFKNGFASAVGQAVIGAQKFGDAIKNLAKQMVAMWVTWMVQRAIAGAFAKTQDKKALAEQAAFGKAALAALAPAAAAKLVLDPGAAAVAATAFATLVGGMIGMASIAGSAMGGIDEGGSGIAGSRMLGEKGRDTLFTGSMPKISAGNGFGVSLFDPQKLATGGLTTGATIAMIGEGRYDEAVMPLYPGMLNDYIDFPEPSNSSSIVFNNFGDINNGTSYDKILDDFNAMVLRGKRGR